MKECDLNEENPYRNLGCISQRAKSKLESFFREHKDDLK
jgi:hypothetical protein